MTRCFIVTLLFSSIANASLTMDPSLGKVVATCSPNKKTSGVPRVWFFKQWHLPPTVNTTKISESKKEPQFENQLAIYQQISAWIEAGKLKDVVSEGCGGSAVGDKMTEKFAPKFNGWDLSVLRAQVSNSEYPSILTAIPMKLEAKYGKQVDVWCGDDDALSKENALAFSDARGELGFLTRLDQFKNQSTQERGFLDGVIEVYHLSRTTTRDQAMDRLKQELKKSVASIEALIQRRNEHLVSVIEEAEKAGAENVAVVFGGAHAEGVQKLLESKGLDCSLVEPLGYSANEAELLERLKQLLSKMD